MKALLKAEINLLEKFPSIKFSYMNPDWFSFRWEVFFFFFFSQYLSALGLTVYERLPGGNKIVSYGLHGDFFKAKFESIF